MSTTRRFSTLKLKLRFHAMTITKIEIPKILSFCSFLKNIQMKISTGNEKQIKKNWE